MPVVFDFLALLKFNQYLLFSTAGGQEGWDWYLRGVTGFRLFDILVTIRIGIGA